MKNGGRWVRIANVFVGTVEMPDDGRFSRFGVSRYRDDEEAVPVWIVGIPGRRGLTFGRTKVWRFKR